MLISRRRFLALVGVSTAAVAACGGSGETTTPPTGGGQGGTGGASGGGGSAGSGGGPPDPGGTIGPTGVSNKVLWLQGAACSGCSVSFLNRLAAEPPETVEDALLDVVLLGYHPTLMAAAGESAIAAAEALYAEGSYLLVVEGGIPTAMGGATCRAWTVDGQELTFVDAVKHFAEHAAIVMSVGTCACWGGVAAAAPNPTGVQGAQQVLGATTLNIPGCPPHPDTIVWGLAQLLAQATIELDQYGRPFELFGQRLHDRCPRLQAEEADSVGVDGSCVRKLGCRGQACWAPCPVMPWNHGANWCVDANANCIGCTEPDFPGIGLNEPIGHGG
jgi:hydrogenase small subunit